MIAFLLITLLSKAGRPCFAHTTVSTTIAARYDAFSSEQDRLFAEDLPFRQFGRLTARSYDILFSRFQRSATLRSLALNDIALLFRATDTADFATREPRFLRLMEADFSVLNSRNRATFPIYSAMYFAYVRNRAFAEATKLAKGHPDIPSTNLPRLIDARENTSLPSVIELSPDGATATRKTFELATGSRVLVVASPLCHFCARVLPTIQSDPRLSQLLRKHVTWLVPPDESTSFDTVRVWNRAHPMDRMYCTYAISDWPMLDRWETPAFYFFKNGRLAFEFAGWPRSGRVRELRRGLRTIGLL